MTSNDTNATECREDISENDLDEILMNFPDKVKSWTVDEVAQFMETMDKSLKKARVMLEYGVNGRGFLKLNRDDIKDMKVKKSGRRAFLHKVVRMLRKRAK